MVIFYKVKRNFIQTNIEFLFSNVTFSVKLASRYSTSIFFAPCIKIFFSCDCSLRYICFIVNLLFSL